MPANAPDRLSRQLFGAAKRAHDGVDRARLALFVGAGDEGGPLTYRLKLDDLDPLEVLYFDAQKHHFATSAPWR